FLKASSKVDGEARLATIMNEKGCHELDTKILDPFDSQCPIAITPGKPIDEHRHPEEEVRFMTQGTAFFDIRDYKDKWVRIRFGEGDILVLPANVYHRFMLEASSLDRRVP
ncbi:unnamed protein product, partial [Ixodes hexagonus]